MLDFYSQLWNDTCGSPFKVITMPCLSFLLCKVSIVITPSIRLAVKVKIVHICKEQRSLQGTNLKRLWNIYEVKWRQPSYPPTNTQEAGSLSTHLHFYSWVFSAAKDPAESWCFLCAAGVQECQELPECWNVLTLLCFWQPFKRVGGPAAI